MPQNRRIYLLDPKKLSPETIAVAFAKTSRSPLPFDAIAQELSDERSADFHEKWVVGYGHSSVAEHAVLHIAVENISRLAIECLESNRLASYTEKSSRYQVWDADHFFIPEEFQDKNDHALFVRTCTLLFEAYTRAFSIISAYLEENLTKQKDENEKGFQTRIRSTCADVCRYFLPASSLANVGVSINARALEHAITKMLSHPLQEVRAIGLEIKQHALKNVPTLVKYAKPNPYLSALNENVFKLKEAELQVKPTSDHDWCTCVACDREGENAILSAFLYRFGNFSMRCALEEVTALNDQARKDLAGKLLAKMGDHDSPSRELEYGAVTFDLVLDQGAYFELKRHRMMTQTVQRFTPDLGYAMPKLIETAGLSDLFYEVMEKARAAFDQLAQANPDASAYVLPNAYNRRVLLQMNLRSAIHLIKLRCAENAHFAIRRPTLRMAEMLQEQFPLFSGVLTPCTTERWETVERQYFTDTRRAR